RYPQLYSRVGFVHAFRPLSAAHVRELLQRKWTPAGVALPEEGVTDEEARAAIIRVTGGNFRLLHRHLTQIARLVEINALHHHHGSRRGSRPRELGDWDSLTADFHYIKCEEIPATESEKLRAAQCNLMRRHQ